MRKIKFVGAFFVTVILSLAAKSQTIDSLITNFTEKSPFEKIYIQFDNANILQENLYGLKPI
jgi:hypothetical protein